MLSVLLAFGTALNTTAPNFLGALAVMVTSAVVRLTLMVMLTVNALGLNLVMVNGLYPAVLYRLVAQICLTALLLWTP